MLCCDDDRNLLSAFDHFIVTFTLYHRQSISCYSHCEYFSFPVCAASGSPISGRHHKEIGPAVRYPATPATSYILHSHNLNLTTHTSLPSQPPTFIPSHDPSISPYPHVLLSDQPTTIILRKRSIASSPSSSLTAREFGNHASLDALNYIHITLRALRLSCLPTHMTGVLCY